MCRVRHGLWRSISERLTRLPPARRFSIEVRAFPTIASVVNEMEAVLGRSAVEHVLTIVSSGEAFDASGPALVLHVDAPPDDLRAHLAEHAVAGSDEHVALFRRLLDAGDQWIGLCSHPDDGETSSVVVAHSKEIADTLVRQHSKPIGLIECPELIKQLDSRAKDGAFAYAAVLDVGAVTLRPASSPVLRALDSTFMVAGEREGDFFMDFEFNVRSEAAASRILMFVAQPAGASRRNDRRNRTGSSRAAACRSNHRRAEGGDGCHSGSDESSRLLIALFSGRGARPPQKVIVKDCLRRKLRWKLLQPGGPRGRIVGVQPCW